MTSKAASIADYLNEQPPERREAIEMVLKVIRANSPKGIEEGMKNGMIGFCVPHSRYPAGYHCNPKDPLPFIGLGVQKNCLSLYMCQIYVFPEIAEWFEQAYRATGKKLDMGKGCVRFKKLEDLPLELVGEVIRKVTVEDYIERYEAVLAGMKSRKPKKST